MQTEFKMCSKTTTLSAHVQRISTVLTTSQLIGFAPLLYHLVEDDHRTWTIISLYIALFLHYALNNILYYGSSQTSGRNGWVLIWLIYYAVEYVGLFVFGVYSAFCVLTWPRRGWPEYYVFGPAVLSGVSLGIALIHVICWIVVLKLYVITGQPINSVVQIMTTDEEKSKNEKTLRSPIKNCGKDNNGFDQSEDEWSNDVIMEIGRKVWNQQKQEYEDKETKKTKTDDRNISRSSNISINPEAIYNSFG